MWREEGWGGEKDGDWGNEGDLRLELANARVFTRI